MPLEFSPFLMPIKNADYLSDAAKYLAEGDKTAAAQAKAQKEPNIYTELNKLGDIKKIYGPSFDYLPKATQEFLSGGIQQVKDEAASYVAGGGTVPLALYNAVGKLNEIKTGARNLEKVGQFVDLMAGYSKEHPGVDPKSLQAEGLKHVLYDVNGNPLPPANIMSGGGAADAFGDFLKNTKGNVFNIGGYVKAMKDSESTEQEVSYTTVGSRGKTSSLSKNLKVPSTIFGLKAITDEKGNETGQYVPQVIEDEGDNKVTISDDKLKNAYKEYNKTAVLPGQEQIKIDDAGNLTTIPSDAISGFRSKYNDIEGHLNQEGNKFEEIAHQQGVVTRDANGAYTPEFAKELENFKRAKAYNAFDDAGEVVGGVKTKRQKIEKESRVSIARPSGGSKTESGPEFIDVYKNDIEAPLVKEEEAVGSVKGQGGRLGFIKATDLSVRANDALMKIAKTNFPNTTFNSSQLYIIRNSNGEIELRGDKGEGNDFKIQSLSPQINLKSQIDVKGKKESVEKEKTFKAAPIPVHKASKTSDLDVKKPSNKKLISIPGMTKS